MKKNQFIKSAFLILSLTAILFTVSCSGSEGPEGPKGEQGAQGIPGKDGAVIHSGTGAPTATLGNVGDMYLDVSTSNLYGPKNSSGWGTPLNLKGATGATGTAGTPGSKILKGTANPPTASIGAVGDYYLNTNTGDLFGPKTSSGWGTPINLKGTANVVASRWVDYNWNSTNTATYKVMEYTMPSPILAAVGYTNFMSFSNAGGAILVYGRNWGTNSIQMFNYEARNGHYEARPNTNGNKIWFFLTSINGSALTDNEYGTNNKFRYVLIPAGVQLSGVPGKDGTVKKRDWKKMSYEEVMEYFNLTE